MIKFVVAALWLCAVTVGAVFYSFQAAAPTAAEAKPDPHFGGLDYVKADIISVPLIRDAKVEGYLLTRLVYTVEPKKMAKLSIPASAIITDQVYSYIYSHPPIDFASGKTLDIEAFRTGIRDAVNGKVNDQLIHEVLVDQIDFLSKDEIRDNALRRRTEATTAQAMSKSFGEKSH